MQVVNFYAGSGAGKSTTAAGLYSELKMQGISVELVTEWIKGVVWDRAWDIMKDQVLVFAQQLHQIKRLEGQVDVVVTDSPLLLTLTYDTSQNFQLAELVRWEYSQYDNVDIFLHRNKPFVQAGRVEDRETAENMDGKIYQMLLDEGILFGEVEGGIDAVDMSLAYIRSGRF